MQCTNLPSSSSSAARILAPRLRFAGAQEKHHGWRPEPLPGEEIRQFTGRRNGGSLDKATVTLVDSFKYCCAGTPHTMPGQEDLQVPCPVLSLPAPIRQGQAGVDPARHRALPAPGKLGFGGCQMAHPHPRGQQSISSPLEPIRVSAFPRGRGLHSSLVCLRGKPFFLVGSQLHVASPSTGCDDTVTTHFPLTYSKAAPVLYISKTSL